MGSLDPLSSVTFTLGFVVFSASALPRRNVFSLPAVTLIFAAVSEKNASALSGFDR